MFKACWRTFYRAKKFQILGNAWEVDVIEQKTHEKPKISNKTVEQNLGQILLDSSGGVFRFVKIEKQN